MYKRKLNDACSNALYAKLLVYGRKTIANTTLLGMFWYTVSLWAGETAELEAIEKKVVNFVWSGASLDTRHRAATKIIIQKQSEGGLGLLSLTKQYTTFAARTIRWAFQPGEHPMQKTIRGLVEEENIAAFGVPGVQWLYTAAKSKPLSNNVGAEEDQRGRKEKAYRRLTDLNMGPREAQMRPEESVSTFFEETEQEGLIWEWKTKGKYKDEQQSAPAESEDVRCYLANNRLITPCKTERVTQQELVYNPVRVIKFRAEQSRAIWAREAELTEETGELNSYKWANGSEFFSASDWQIRGILTQDTTAMIEKIQRWQYKIDCIIWHRMRIYTKTEWKKLKPEEHEVFKRGWAFEAAKIALNDDGSLAFPKLAPWRTRPEREEERGEPPRRSEGRERSLEPQQSR
ncbi:hypothetical protein R1sor_019127 [Riccia sorocarpa]|uniref:Uncharacterized protein n=1 Tax=Riccia sorocarpa TaxID=122646 RepID=A0ABD3IFF3_9MARC